MGTNREFFKSQSSSSIPNIKTYDPGLECLTQRKRERGVMFGRMGGADMKNT